MLVSVSVSATELESLEGPGEVWRKLSAVPDRTAKRGANKMAAILSSNQRTESSKGRV